MPDRHARAATPQLELFLRPATSEVERVLKDIDLNRVTPIEALALLSRLKELAETR